MSKGIFWLLVALAVAVIFAGVSAFLQRTGTADEAAYLVQVGADGAQRAFAYLWPG